MLDNSPEPGNRFNKVDDRAICRSGMIISHMLYEAAS